MKIIKKVENLIKLVKAHKKRFVKSYEALLKVWEGESKKYREAHRVYSEAKVAGTIGDDELPPISPEVPDDRTEVYEFYLSMLEHHVGDTIELDEDLFRKLVKDKWSWMLRHIRALGQWASMDADVGAFYADYSESVS